LALLLAAAVCGLLVSQDRELGRLRTQAARLHDALAPPQSRPAPSPETQQQLKRADAVLDALLLPWDDLFAMVEGAGSNGLALLALTPDPASQSLRIAGLAKSLEDALDFTARLSAQPQLSEVHLVSYETVTREGVSLVQFTIGARWKKS
jgi:hypothetical protein